MVVAFLLAPAVARAADPPATSVPAPTPAPAAKAPAAAAPAKPATSTPATPAKPATTPPATPARPGPVGVDPSKIDCSNAKPQFRSRCLELQRVQKVCVGKDGDAKKACIQQNIKYARLKADCSGAKTAQGRDKCLQNNRMLDAAVACEGKSGEALRQCAAARSIPHGTGP